MSAVSKADIRNHFRQKQQAREAVTLSERMGETADAISSSAVETHMTMSEASDFLARGGEREQA